MSIYQIKMNKVFKCPICSEKFNAPKKTPLTLPCGDVLCKECLLSFTSNPHSTIQCPLHKTSFNININSLPICKTILQFLPKQKTREFVCKQHPNKRIKYFCTFDNDALCSKCLSSHSNQSQHKISQFTPTKTALINEINFVTERVGDRLLSIKADSQMNAEYKNVLVTHTKDEIKTLEIEFNRIITQITSTKNRMIEKMNNIFKYQLDIVEEKILKYKEQEEKCVKTKKAIESFINQLNKNDVIYDDVIETKKMIIQQWEVLLKNGNTFGLGNGIALPKIVFNNTKTSNDFKNLVNVETISYHLTPTSSLRTNHINTSGINNEEYLMLKHNTNTTSNNQSDNITRTNTKESSGNSNNHNGNAIRSNSSKNTQNITNRRKYSAPIESNNSRIYQERKSVNKPIMINKETNLLRELTDSSNNNFINQTYESNHKSKGDLSDRRFDTSS